MGITKRMAVAVSGLVFAGGAASAVGAAAPASAQTPVTAPQQMVSSGCCGGGHSRFHRSHRTSWRHNQRIIVINRNNNFSKSGTGQAQHEQQRQEFEEQNPQKHKGS
jgi:hypothetical protein